MLCDGWHHQVQVSSLSCISSVTVTTQPRHAGLCETKLSILSPTHGRLVVEEFPAEAATQRQENFITARCQPAEISWMPLLVPYRTVELRSAPWKHSICASGALQFGLTLCL